MGQPVNGDFWSSPGLSRLSGFYCTVQPKITTCTLGLATVVITLGNLASFPSYSSLVYMIL